MANKHKGTTCKIDFAFILFNFIDSMETQIQQYLNKVNNTSRVKFSSESRIKYGKRTLTRGVARKIYFISTLMRLIDAMEALIQQRYLNKVNNIPRVKIFILAGD